MPDPLRLPAAYFLMVDFDFLGAFFGGITHLKTESLILINLTNCLLKNKNIYWLYIVLYVLDTSNQYISLVSPTEIIITND